MKRLIFLLVSAFIATTSFCANVTENFSEAIGKNDEAKIEKEKKQPLILEKAEDLLKNTVSWHYSHSSHSSHSSHWSHRSHSSHYSGW